jgi:tetraacyldisaccharide-1-P 4'-kinase
LDQYDIELGYSGALDGVLMTKKDVVYFTDFERQDLQYLEFVDQG